MCNWYRIEKLKTPDKKILKQKLGNLGQIQSLLLALALPSHCTDSHRNAKVFEAQRLGAFSFNVTQVQASLPEIRDDEFGRCSMLPVCKTLTPN